PTFVALLAADLIAAPSEYRETIVKICLAQGAALWVGVHVARYLLSDRARFRAIVTVTSVVALAAGFYATPDSYRLVFIGALISNLIVIGFVAGKRSSTLGSSQATNTSPALSIPVAVTTVFIASFCSMALELGASRFLAPTVGVSLYS